MRYTQLTDDNVRHMLDGIGAAGVEDLFSTIPPRLRLRAPLNLPRGISELELLNETTALASRNRNCTELVCFAGGGAYDHFIPTVVDALSTGQSEFLTAYTPYQAEASQGILQLFYEFQTMICMLTGMDVSNASLYESASAVAEAVLMALSITGRRRVLVVDTVHPDSRGALAAYLRQQEAELTTLTSRSGVADESLLADVVDDQTAAVVIQSPNFFGCVERLDKMIPLIH